MAWKGAEETVDLYLSTSLPIKICNRGANKPTSWSRTDERQSRPCRIQTEMQQNTKLLYFVDDLLILTSNNKEFLYAGPPQRNLIRWTQKFFQIPFNAMYISFWHLQIFSEIPKKVLSHQQLIVGLTFMTWHKVPYV